ncbi:MAG: hypothetical protein V1738_01425 [Patescibacteria group bacterium]
MATAAVNSSRQLQSVVTTKKFATNILLLLILIICSSAAGELLGLIIISYRVILPNPFGGVIGTIVRQEMGGKMAIGLVIVAVLIGIGSWIYIFFGKGATPITVDDLADVYLTECEFFNSEPIYYIDSLEDSDPVQLPVLASLPTGRDLWPLMLTEIPAVEDTVSVTSPRLTDGGYYEEIIIEIGHRIVWQSGSVFKPLS